MKRGKKIEKRGKKKGGRLKKIEKRGKKKEGRLKIKDKRGKKKEGRLKKKEGNSLMIAVFFRLKNFDFIKEEFSK